MTALTDLTDVVITDPQVGDRLTYRDALWVNEAVSDWVRNPSWEVLPTITAAEQKVAILVAIYDNDSNFTAFTISAAYTVDWGDGTSANFATGTTASKLYDYADTDLDGTNAPVTLTDSGDLVTRTAHGHSDGDFVTMYDVVTTTGPVSGQKYYVINATADTFQISTSEGGSAVAFTGDGTAALLPYKQAVIIITPQAANNLTSVNFQVRHSGASAVAYDTRFLDVTISVPNATSLTFGGGSVVHRSIQRVDIKTIGSVTNMSAMFQNCTTLTSVPLFNTASVTNMTQMFSSCAALQTVPLFNTASVTNMNSMFSSCSALQTVPLFNTAAVTNMPSVFQNCSALQTVPLFNTAAVTSMNNMFQGCSSLQTVPPFNTASVTNMNSMFSSCSALQTIPAFDMSAITADANLSSWVSGCSSLAKCEATGIKVNVSFASCNLSAAALNEIYTNLATAAKTITVTSNYGVAGDDPTIATAKTWTVTG